MARLEFKPDQPDFKSVLSKWGFPDGSAVKNSPAIQEPQEIRVWSLGQEDPLEKEMATHYSIFIWGISRTEKPGKLRSMGSQKSQTQLSSWTLSNHCLTLYLLHKTGCTVLWPAVYLFIQPLLQDESFLRVGPRHCYLVSIREVLLE